MIQANALENSITVPVPRYLPWLVVFSAALFFFYEFIQMHMFNAISPDLISDFHISATTLGYVSASYFYADVLFLFPAGILLDRISSKKIILTAMLICVVSTALFSRSSSIVIVFLCHFAAGIGNAFCFLSCIRIAAHWFPNRQMALVIGLIVTMAMLGGVVAQTPLTWLVNAVGWRNALLFTAILGAFISILVYLFVQDYPPYKAQIVNEQKQKCKNLGLLASIKIVFANPQNWHCGLYTAFMNLPLMLLGGLWGGLYLTTVQHLTRLQASYVTMMVFWGTIFGGPIIGWISDKLGLRRSPMIIFAVLSIPVMVGIIYISNLSLFTLIVLFFLLGFFTASQIIAYPTIEESNDKAITGTAMGLASVLIMGAPALFEPIYGWLMDKNWDGTIVNGAHYYTAHAYYYSMLMLPAMLIVGLIASFLVRETFAQGKQS